MTRSISNSERFISDHQLDAQEALIDVELIRLDIQMTEYSSAEVWKFKDELRAIKKGIKIARKDLHLLPVGRKWLWQRLRIWVYEWSVRGRYE